MDKELLQMLGQINTNMVEMKTSINTLDKRMDSLDKRMDSLDKHVTKMDNKIENLDERLRTVETDIKYIKIKGDENGTILRILEDKALTNKAEHDNIIHNMAEISGEVKGLSKDLNLVEAATASNWSDIVRLKGLKL